MKAKNNIEILLEVNKELKRFKKKIHLAIIEQSESGNYSSKNYAAAKRGAMDLKNELTKLTQASKYKYSE